MKNAILLTFSIFHFSFFIAYSQQIDSLLIEAVKSNNYQKVKELVHKKANVNATDRNNATVLMWAALKSDLKMIKFLIDKGADYSKKGKINLPDNNFYGNLLIIASAEGKYPLVKYLIEDLDIPVDDKELILETGIEEGWTPLQWAALKNQTKIAELLHENGADINANHTEDKGTPLLYALQNKYDSLGTILINRGANVNLSDRKGLTAMHIAAGNGMASVVKLLIDKGANVNAPDNSGKTPFFFALGLKNLDIAMLLIENAAQINKICFPGETVLHFVENPDITLQILEKGADVNAKSNYGITPLHRVQNIDIARIFIEKGADVNAKDNDDITPLHYARTIDIASLLIDKGANVNSKSNFGSTPLHFVNEADIARLLISKGADVNAKDDNGDTPLHLAETTDIASLLIEKGASVTAKNNDGDNPLHLAKTAAIARLLIEKEADINAKDNNGNTPLHLAKTTDIAQLFLENGTSVDPKNNDGITPLHWAETADFARLLIEKGANVNIKSNNGKTPLHLAENGDLVRLLIEKGADMNVADKDGNTPLSKNLIASYFELSEIFLEKGVDIDFRNSEGQTALMRVVIESDSFEAIDFMLNHEANALIKDNNEKTALDYASAIGKEKFVALLSVPKLIQVLQSKGQQAVIALLKKDIIGVDQKDTYGLTLLHHMVYQSCDTLLSFIITHFKNAPLLNILNSEHQTPLLYAIYLSNSKYAQGLIEAGADVNVPGLYGETPLYMADYYNLKNIMISLKNQKSIIKPPLYPTELSIPIGHLTGVTCLSISPDGKMFISGDGANKIILWDIATGKQVRSFAEPENYALESLCFSPDGKYFISANYGNTIKLWDIASSRKLRTFQSRSTVSSLCFAPDGKSFISGGDRAIKLWDLATGKELYSSDYHEGWITGLVFAPDGKSFFSGGEDGSIKQWEIFTGKEKKTFIGHKNPVTCLSISADGKSILSGCKDSTIILWDILSGKELKSFQGHTGLVAGVCFSPDGRYFISGSDDRTIKLWDIETGKELKTLYGHTDKVTSLGYLPIGKNYISGSGDNSIKLWDNATGISLQTFQGISKKIYSIDISKNGEKLLAEREPDIKVFDLALGKIVKTFIGYNCFVSGLFFAPNGESFISINRLLLSFDYVKKLWDIITDKEIKTFDSYKDYVSNLNFFADGNSSISGSYDNTIKLWDLASGKEIRSFAGHSYRVTSVCFSPEGETFVSGSYDTIKLWDVASGKEIRSFVTYKGDVSGLSFSPDGKSFIAGFDDPVIIMWDIKTGQKLRSFPGHSGDVNDVSFSPDGKTVLSCSWDRTIILWDAATGLPIRKFTGHTSEITKVKFHPSGKFFLSCSSDNTIKFWNIDSTKEIATLVFIDSSDWIMFTPDKYYATTKIGAKSLGWVKGTMVWNFDQWDLQYNRPDIVFSRMPDADTAMIKLYYKAYQKRLKKMKFQESMFKSDFHTPEIQIKKQTLTALDLLELEIAVEDTLYSMDRINVWVNEVPVYGINGISLRSEKQSVSVPVQKHISLKLSEGDNKIELSVLNSAGAESLKQTAYAKNENPSVKKDLYFIAISCADYKDNRYNLKYSVKDGRDIVKEFAGEKSNYGNIFIDTLFNLDVTREKVTALKQKLMKSNVSDQVVLFTSGHGLLDDSLNFYFATYDMDFNHPEKRGISFDDLESILDSIPARKKLLMMDACHSGEVDREEVTEIFEANTEDSSDIAFRGSVREYNFKGVNPKTTQSGISLNNSFELMQELFAGLDKGTGTTVISAAAGKGYALESPQWNNGVFTYSVINGIRNKAADKNRDGNITLSELKEYSVRQVELLTNGKQKPTTRRESINYDWIIR